MYFLVLLALSFSRLVLSLSFLCLSVSEALFALIKFVISQVNVVVVFPVHAKAALAYSRNK